MARLLYAVGRFLVYEPLKNALGFSRVRVAYTAGEAIGPDLFRFYRSLGMNLKQFYGQTEAFILLTSQTDRDVRPDTVGPVVVDVDVRISDDGEVLYKSASQFLGYLKDAERTAEAMTADGYVKTGDAGFFDGAGHLHIIDRAKDVGRLRERRAVRAQIYREQAQILSQHPRSGGVRRRPRFRDVLSQYRPDRGRRLGRAQRRHLWLLSGTGRT